MYLLTWVSTEVERVVIAVAGTAHSTADGIGEVEGRVGGTEHLGTLLLSGSFEVEGDGIVVADFRER